MIQQILKSLNVPYSHTWILSIINKPFINTFYGISRILSLCNISNKCVKFEDKKLLLSHLCPCVVPLGSQFYIVQNIDSSISLTSEKGEIIIISYDSFLELWNGEAILFEKNDNSGEPNYHSHIKQERIFIFKTILAILSISILLLTTIFQLTRDNINISTWVVITINIIGLFISYLQLQEQLHIPNKFTDKVCGMIKNSDCEAVANSDGATLGGVVTLSEIGCAFFSVNLIILFLSQSTIWALAIAAACVLPFSFWSIWYQRFKIKKWCVLCLSSISLMWLQAIAYWFGGAYKISHFDITTAIILISCYILAIISINRVMSLIEEKKKGEMWRLAFNQFKAQNNVIDLIEGEAPSYIINSEECSALTFGKSDAQYKITIYSNPYCSHCSDLHEKILKWPGDVISIRYIFTYFSEEMSIINKYLIAAYQQLGADKAWTILSEWYNKGHLMGESFFKQFNLDINTQTVEDEFNKQSNWRKINNSLIGTPTVIIGNKELIYPYTIEDFIYIHNT